MKAGSCFNRAESSVLNDTSKSLVLVNYFRSVPIKLLACVQNSGDLINMLPTCHDVAANRWANFVAVDFYKVFLLFYLLLDCRVRKSNRTIFDFLVQLRSHNPLAESLFLYPLLV